MVYSEPSGAVDCPHFPGFRYTIGVFSREGVRTVNGALLPKVKVEDAAEDEAGTGEDQ